MEDNTATAGRHIPGEAGVWILIFGDLMVFSLFFVTFADYRASQVALFQASQAQLSQAFGLINTLLLLTSSWLLAEALNAARRQAPHKAARLASGAILLGLGFVIVKIFEYAAKFDAGIGPSSNEFFMLYFAFTGVHLLHVLVGIGLLLFVRSRLSRPIVADGMKLVECAAIFWHLVDILWVILFALLYLHR